MSLWRGERPAPRPRRPNPDNRSLRNVRIPRQNTHHPPPATHSWVEARPGSPRASGLGRCAPSTRRPGLTIGGGRYASSPRRPGGARSRGTPAKSGIPTPTETISSREDEDSSPQPSNPRSFQVQGPLEKGTDGRGASRSLPFSRWGPLLSWKGIVFYGVEGPGSARVPGRNGLASLEKGGKTGIGRCGGKSLPFSRWVLVLKGQGLGI